MRCTVPVPMPRDLATIPLMVRWIACTTRSSVSPVATLTATGTAHVTYVTAERYAQLGGPRRARRSVRRSRVPPTGASAISISRPSERYLTGGVDGDGRRLV